MAVTGFNVGTTLSLKEISLAVDFLSDKDAFEPDLQNIKDTITSKEKTVDDGGRSDLTEVTAIERGENVDFERYRRITGYLVPDIDRWNPGKKQELKDRAYNRT